MPSHRIGQSTILLPNRPRVVCGAGVVGVKEGEGPLGADFDRIVSDDLFGEESWEKAEAHFQHAAASACLEKAGLLPSQLDAVLGGDLLNQIIASTLSARELQAPFLGLYGACSTMAESLLLAALLVDGGYLRHALCCTGSHFCSAERQYRFPLEYGCQRTPTAQWTVTGAGATLLSGEETLPALCRIPAVTPGRIVDLGVTDANNMGAAMAPAAADTLSRHLKDLGRTAADYDLIITGDLGRVGHDVLLALMQERGQPLIPGRAIDCGLEIFRPEQNVQAGGSGCGCSAAVLNGPILRRFREGGLRRVFFLATGALLSTTSSQQGGTIPGIAHGVVLEADA